MTTRSKRYQDLSEEIKSQDDFDSLEAAAGQVKEAATANFVETVECHVKVNIDPTNADQQIRESLVLPAGTGQEVRVVVFAQGEKQQEAEEAGADVVGADDLIERIDDGWLDFDAAVATPDMMSEIGRLGPVLGPRGLMPNNKSGTVTFDVAETIKKIKQGQVELRNDSYGIIHTPVGTDAMSAGELADNLEAVLGFVVEQRPPEIARGQYFDSITITSTMSPPVRIQSALAWDLV